MQQNLNSIDLYYLRKEFNKKECLKHTFHLKCLNIYYYIPIFQQGSIIQFRGQYYIIVKLKRRTETYLQYKVKDRWNYKQEILIQYQYFFDKDLMDDKYEYFEDQTQALSRDDQIFRQYSRIAIKKQDIHNNSSLKLPRFIHLNNYNEYGKIQILYHLSNYKTIDLLDYNQIQVNDLWQLEIIQRNQNKNQLFIQVPLAMDQRVQYQQIQLIGIYYVIIHNLVIFNRYLNQEYHLEQSLRSFKSSHQHLQQLIIESIKYKHELQTPKIVLEEIKNQISSYRKIIVCFLIIKQKFLIKTILLQFHANFKIQAQKKFDNFLKIGQNFIQITQLINKNSRKHTFQLPNNNDYREIPIFQKYEKIKFQNKFYQILKLQRRTETYLQYKIQNLDTLQVFSIEYQFIFDSNYKDDSYQYFSDETCTFNDNKSYRQNCRIALKSTNQHPKLQKLTRFVHLNNLNSNQKLALLHYFANDDQLEQLDYNQIYINIQLQITKLKINIFQQSCFIQAPTSISNIVSFKQTFLIGFYYSIINNIITFNSYINKQKMIEQSLRVTIYNHFQLEKQIIGSINYQYKLQIPKNVLKQAINKIFRHKQLEHFCLLILLFAILKVVMSLQYSRYVQIPQGNEQEENNIFIETEQKSKYMEIESKGKKSLLYFNFFDLSHNMIDLTNNIPIDDRIQTKQKEADMSNNALPKLRTKEIESEEIIINLLNQRNNFIAHSNFAINKFFQKDSFKHTFKLKELNKYQYIPIFQNDERINFGNQFYKIIRLQRRTENFLQYRIQELEKQQLLTIEYQFIFNDELNDQNYLYYKDQTKIFNNESLYRNSCRIAIKKTKKRHLKLIRYLHLNNLNYMAKIKLLNIFANDDQLEQLDYNQIYIDDKQQIKISKIQQNQNSCFIQAPISISPILHFQQTFLIGFYYSIINNLVFFNQYINREDNIKQALQNGYNISISQFQQQIKGTINYQYKLQIPKQILLQTIKKIIDQYQKAEYLFLCVLIDTMTSLRIQQLGKNLQQSIVQLQKLNNQLEEIIINTEPQQNQTNSSFSIDEQSSDTNYLINLVGGSSNRDRPDDCNKQIEEINTNTKHVYNQTQTSLSIDEQSSSTNYSVNLLIGSSIIECLDLHCNKLSYLDRISNKINKKIQASFFFNLYNLWMIRKEHSEHSEHSEHFIELPQETNFIEKKKNRSKKGETFLKFRSLFEELKARISAKIQFCDSKKQNQSINNGYRFAASINEDFEVEILIELKQLFQMVEVLMEIMLRDRKLEIIDNS